MAVLRVLVVEDSAVMGETLAMALDFEAGLDCVGVAPTIRGALELAAERRPHVVLMDVHLFDGSGLEATAELKRICPEASVIVLTAHSDPVYLLRAAEAGASGFLVKESPMAQIVRIIRLVAEGEPGVQPQALRALVGEALKDNREAPVPLELTPPERDILQLLGDGFGADDMAARLGVTVAVARDRVAALVARFGARSQLETIAMAARMGLLSAG